MASATIFVHNISEKKIFKFLTIGICAYGRQKILLENTFAKNCTIWQLYWELFDPDIILIWDLSKLFRVITSMISGHQYFCRENFGSYNPKYERSNKGRNIFRKYLSSKIVLDGSYDDEVYTSGWLYWNLIFCQYRIHRKYFQWNIIIY